MEPSTRLLGIALRAPGSLLATNSSHSGKGRGKRKKRRPGRPLVLNRALGFDPSRTTTLRKRFMADMRKRMGELRRLVIEAIEVLDVLGLVKEEPPIVRLEAGELITNAVLPPRRAFQFQTSTQKVASFQQWFQGQVNASLLSVDSAGNPWTSKYVNSAYRQGVVRGFLDAKRASGGRTLDRSLPGLSKLGLTQEQFLLSAFASPERTSKALLLATRTFESLKGVSATMAQEMNRQLADGILRGDNPRTIARKMAKTIDGLTSKRAELIARTEIIHAHAEGQLDSFEDLGIEDVGIEAEWSTAGDNRVCPICEGLNGQVMSVSEARGLIPIHPGCRCAWIPATKETKAKFEKRKENIRKAAGIKTPPKRTAAAKKAAPSQAKKVEDDLTAVFEDLVAARKTMPTGSLVGTSDEVQRAEALYQNRLAMLRAARTPKQRAQVIDDMLDGMFSENRVYQAEGLGKADEIRAAAARTLDQLPDDILARLEANQVRFVEDLDRANWDYRNFAVDLDQERGGLKADIQWVMDHEVSHAVDSLLSAQGGGLTETTAGEWISSRLSLARTPRGDKLPQWIGDARVRELDGAGAALKRKVDDLVKVGGRQRGFYSNGDGSYWSANWVHDYEGRIYRTAAGGERAGVEFWSMNSQRFLAQKRVEEAIPLLLDKKRADEVLALIRKEGAFNDNRVAQVLYRSGLKDSDVGRFVNGLIDHTGGSLNQVREWEKALKAYGRDLRDVMERVYGAPRVEGQAIAFPAKPRTPVKPPPAPKPKPKSVKTTKPKKAPKGPSAPDRPSAPDHKEIAEQLGISNTQAKNLVRTAQDTASSIMGERVAKEEVQGFLGRFVTSAAERGGTTTAKVKHVLTSVKDFVANHPTYKLFDGWYKGEGIGAAIARGTVYAAKLPLRGYLKSLSYGIKAAGYGLPRNVQLTGYWTGIGVSYVLTPAMPWLAIPGASDAFAIGSLLGIQVPYRAYQATRWVGQSPVGQALGKVVKAGLRSQGTPRPQGIVGRNLNRAMERAITHGKALAGRSSDLAKMAKEAATTGFQNRAAELAMRGGITP